MINWFNMPAEGLSNGGLFEIKELTATENKVYQKDGEVYNKVTVNVEGGGGSSDFSTAEVTVNANTQQFEFFVPLINEKFGYLGAYDNIFPSESETLTVGLYKGKAVTRFYTSGVVSVSGNAQLMNEQILITGDCTITIS